MFRMRLASLILSGSLMATASGCMHGGGSFMGASRWHGTSAGADCTCSETSGGLFSGAAPISAEGPVLVSPEMQQAAPYPGSYNVNPPSVQPPTTTQPPYGPPPRIVPIPAQPMPWSGQH